MTKINNRRTSVVCLCFISPYPWLRVTAASLGVIQMVKGVGHVSNANVPSFSRSEVEVAVLCCFGSPLRQKSGRWEATAVCHGSDAGI